MTDKNMRNFKMVVEYDGSAYRGWQRQKNGLSIQQVLEEAIKKITAQKVSVIGSGRTDAGVHALNQVASFRCATKLPVNSIYRGVNSVLPEDIVVKEMEEVEGEKERAKRWKLRLEEQSVSWKFTGSEFERTMKFGGRF
ncbi:MAG: tRNA pseudouridine synthase A [Deltaproteobacteria bacterium]|nr:tRNA pseudouridine synthase A [Deltaproteobacteria bacterium]